MDLRAHARAAVTPACGGTREGGETRLSKRLHAVPEPVRGVISNEAHPPGLLHVRAGREER
eukprot:6015757-Pleurochrysis_carterae.AAC.1